MGRCWGCCQENCGYTYCTCDCHGPAVVVPVVLKTPVNSVEKEPVKQASSKIKRKPAGRRIGKVTMIENALEDINVLLASHGLEIVITAETDDDLFLTIERQPEVDYTR